VLYKSFTYIYLLTYFVVPYLMLIHLNMRIFSLFILCSQLDIKSNHRVSGLYYFLILILLQTLLNVSLRICSLVIRFSSTLYSVLYARIYVCRYL